MKASWTGEFGQAVGRGEKKSGQGEVYGEHQEKSETEAPLRTSTTK